MGEETILERSGGELSVLERSIGSREEDTLAGAANPEEKAWILAGGMISSQTSVLSMSLHLLPRPRA